MELIFKVSLFIPVFLFFLLKSITKTTKQQYLQAGRLPPGPKALPLIGCMHYLLHRRPVHHTLRDLSAVHGPIMHLRLGEIPTVIISSAEAACAIMKTHDLIFASRPHRTSIKIICYGGKDLIFAPHGDFWRQMRRICILELLSPKRVRGFRAIREDEVTLFVQSIAASSGGMVNLSSKLANLSISIMSRAVVGGKSDNQQVFLSALGTVAKLALSFSMADQFPSMPTFISRLASSRLKECWVEFDKMLEKILQEHSAKRETAHGRQEEDLTDVLLRIQHDESLQFPLSTDHIKAVINDMLMAGTETTATTMEWAMSELVRNPKVMKKAQSEVRGAFERSSTKMIGEEELVKAKLSYLQLVIKETLRLHPPAPLLLPRENQEDCDVLGYRIPAKSTVMVNVWAIGRDPRHWDEPNAFWPERFEEKDFDYKGTKFEFMPFGSGRRICPAIQLGLATIELTLTYLLYYFDWNSIIVKGEDLDMDEALGVVSTRKNPLCLVATPYFPLPAI